MKKETKMVQIKRVTKDLYIKEQLLQNCVIEIEEKNIESQKLDSIIADKKEELSNLFKYKTKREKGSVPRDARAWGR